MSKKRTGLLIAFGAALGAAAAGISYYLKYRSFNDELDKDFHDYEDDEPSNEEEETAPLCKTSDPGVTERSYITLDSVKRKPINGSEAEETGSPEEEAAKEECPDKEVSSAVIEEDTDGVNA